MKDVHAAALCGTMALAQGCSWQQLSDAQEAKLKQSFALNQEYVDPCMMQIVDASVHLPGPDGTYLSPKEMKSQLRDIQQLRKKYLEQGKFVVMTDAEMDEKEIHGSDNHVEAFHSTIPNRIAIRASAFHKTGRGDNSDLDESLRIGPNLGLIELTADTVNHELGHTKSRYDKKLGKHGHTLQTIRESGSDMQRVYDVKDYSYTVSNIGSLVMDYMYSMQFHSAITLDYYLGKEDLTPELLDTAASQLYSMGLSEDEYLNKLIGRSKVERSRLDVLGIPNEEMAHIVFDCLYDYQVEIDTEVYESLVQIAEEENNESRQEAQHERRRQIHMR